MFFAQDSFHVCNFAVQESYDLGISPAEDSCEFCNSTFRRDSCDICNFFRTKKLQFLRIPHMMKLRSWQFKLSCLHLFNIHLKATAIANSSITVSDFNFFFHRQQFWTSHKQCITWWQRCVQLSSNKPSRKQWWNCSRHRRWPHRWVSETVTVICKTLWRN